METLSLTPVQLIQELMAIHSTRIEMASRLAQRATGAGGERMQAAAKQSERFNSALLNELSSFGDGVSSDANRDNAYIREWAQVLSTLDGLSPDNAARTFSEFEQLLTEHYTSLLVPDLPASLEKLIASQAKLVQAV
jgi:hypothetical protein